VGDVVGSNYTDAKKLWKIQKKKLLQKKKRKKHQSQSGS